MTFLLSLLLVAFGQPAWIRGCGSLAAAFGFALFWRLMLSFSQPSRRFLLALLWFSSVQAIQLSWMATTDYMGPLILLVYLFLILAIGAQFGLLSLLISPSVSSLALAGSWVLFEWSRLFFLSGFTWNHVGLALADSPYSLQFASLFGIFGLSFWVILVNCAALKALLEKTVQKAALWACLALTPYLFGLVHQTWIESHIPIAKTLRIALVQTGLFPEQKDFFSNLPHAQIPPQEQWERIFSVLDLNHKIDLLVLPEAALPLGAHRAGFNFSEIQHHFHPDSLPPLDSPYAVLQDGVWRVSHVFIFQAIANQLDAHVITGLDDSDATGRYNAAFHFYPRNELYERYEKRVLVPVGEYVPMSQFRKVARFIGEQFGIYTSFDSGVEGKVFQAQVPMGISICIEETFSSLIRDLRLKGAELLVNVSNDVWFPRSKLTQQHFDHGRVRAVENGVPIVRACNTGITGGIDCFGRPLAQLPVSEQEAFSLQFSLPIRSYPTLYTWWGDGAILAISAVSCLSVVWLQRKRCRKSISPLTFLKK